MLPIQDAVPSGRVPLATITLLIINAITLAARLLTGAFPSTLLLTPFLHLSAAHFIASMLFLWLFGDNVEARVGRGMFIAIYIVCAAAGSYVGFAVAGTGMSLGAASAVTGVLGAYFVLLPKSRILVFIPVPWDLTETPALFFLALWWVLHVISFVTGPGPAAPSLLWALLASFVVGAAICLLTRRQIVW